MKLNVTRSFPYKELIITEDNVKLTSGLLNNDEQKELARKFVDAAYDLIYNVKPEIGEKLARLLEEM